MRKLVLVVVAVGLLMAAPVARGEIRTVTAQDGQDATPTISGVPNNPDIRQVAVVYDTAGSLTLTVDFYNSIATLDKSQNYKFWGKFSVGEGYGAYGDPGSCHAGGAAGDIYGQHNVLGSFYDRATVGGFDGYLNFTNTESVDKKTFVLTASSPVLANRNYRCLEYSLYARAYSSVSNINSDYDAGCDCWFIGTGLDTIRGEVTYGSISGRGVWFDGQQPPPPPPAPTPPPEQVKGKLTIAARGGCRRATLSSWKVLPWAGGAPVSGTIRAKLGREVREFPATSTTPVQWQRVKPGYRLVHVVYLGDERRTSVTADTSVRVNGRGCGRR